MAGNGIQCRIATDDDWDEIWPIVSAVVRRGDTYTFAPDVHEGDARSAWMLDGSSRAATYVATVDGVIVATACLKPNQPGLGDHIANAGWMVAPAASGRGIGREFAEFVIDEARRLGYLGMQFNAVGRDERSGSRTVEVTRLRHRRDRPRARSGTRMQASSRCTSCTEISNSPQTDFRDPSGWRSVRRRTRLVAASWRG